jgi:protein-disulfide isomerase
MVRFSFSIPALVAVLVLSGCAARNAPESPPAEVVVSATKAAAPPEALPAPGFAQLAAGRYYRGARQAPVTLVEFADYECPFCGQDEAVIERLMNEYGGKLKLVYRDYPVGHPHSMLLAEAARCAGEQDGFWKMHDYEFRNMNQLDTEHLGKYGTQLGLDGPAIEECINSRRYESAIAADAVLAESSGARGTPTFYVNGRMLDGMQTYDQLKAAIDQALATAPPPPSASSRRQ